MGNLIDRDDDLIRRGDAHTIEVKQGLFDDTFGLCRFGHHPDPAIDFCIEVEKLQSRLFDAKCCLSKPGTTPETVAAVLHDIKKAMDFRVGGDEGAVNAKHTLRALEADAIAALPAVTVGVTTEDIDALAYRFWSIHFKDIPEPVGMPEGYRGGRRAWFYATEIRRILAALEPVTPAPEAWHDLTREQRIDALRAEVDANDGVILRLGGTSETITLAEFFEECVKVLAPPFPQPAPDAAAIREAALREAVKRVENCTVFANQDRVSAEWHSGVRDACQYHVAAILALITEKPHA